MSGRFFKLVTAWEDLFDADIIGDGTPAHSFTDEGVPMRFAHVQYGQKRADIGFTVRINGVDVDVASLWAAKGTAVYINASAVSGTILHVAVGNPPSVTATASITFGRNGVVDFAPSENEPENYILPPGPTVGDAYKLRFRLLNKSALGTLSATLNTFMVINQSLSVSLQYTRSQSGALRAWANLLVDIHRATDDAHLHTYTVRLEAEADIS